MKSENEQQNKLEELMNKDFGIEYESQLEKEHVIKSMIQFSEIIIKLVQNKNNNIHLSQNENKREYKQAA